MRAPTASTRNGRFRNERAASMRDTMTAVAPSHGASQSYKQNGDAIMRTFTPDGYLREPDGPQFTYRGPAELRSLFDRWFGAGGGIGLQRCAVTDDGVRCALEYNCVRWGRRKLAPQAGLAVCEREADGLLAAVRIYDDVARPRP